MVGLGRLGLSGVLSGALCAASLLVACGGDTSVFGDSGAGGSTAQGGSSQGGTTSQGGSGGVGGTSTGVGGTGTGDGGGGAGIPCEAETYETALPNIDMVLMYDVSASTTQFASTMQQQVAAFASQPWRDGDRVAVNFHPDGNNICEIGNYTPMDLPLTAIPQNAAMVQTLIENHLVTGASPLSPVMQTSLQYAVDEKQMAMERVVVAVLMMDSQPNQCDTQQQTFITMANSALGFDVRTFIIALPNQNVVFMDPIAQAGGTGSAIDLSSFGDESEIGKELTGIRRRAVPCGFPIPEPSMEFLGDPSPMVQYTPNGNGTSAILMEVANEAACGDDGPGWYEASPGRGMLCPGSCTEYKKDTSPLLEVVYSCR